MVKANKSKNNVKNLKTVSINNLSHFYGKNENKKQVLNHVNLNIDKGELGSFERTFWDVVKRLS